jgi:hypothetical protein
MIKRIGTVMAAGMLLATLATSAHAGKVLWTAPAQGAYPGLQTLFCDIVNVGTTPQEVTIDILDYFGNVVQGPLQQLLVPEQGTALGDGSGSGARCRFTVSGSTKKVRAIAMYDNGSAYTVAIPAY